MGHFAKGFKNLKSIAVNGSDYISSYKKIEDAIVEALENGARLISVHYLTSDLPYHGAINVATPFFRACARLGM